METARCILIVEDNEVVRDMLAVALQAYGYTVATAATVHEAEAAMQQRGPTAIGLVIADINLTSDREAREGYALYQRWTTAYPRLAYLLTSGDRTNAALPAIRDGVVAFLAKPFGLIELLDTVQALFSEHTYDGVPGEIVFMPRTESCRATPGKDHLLQHSCVSPVSTARHDPEHSATALVTVNGANTSQDLTKCLKIHPAKGML